MDPIIGGGILSLLSKAIDKVSAYIPDPEQRAKAQMDILQLRDGTEARELAALVASDQGQIEVNKLDAASGSLYRGGWRPFIGWICGVALGYQFLLRPLLGWLSAVQGWEVPPPLEMGDLLTLLIGMLGLGVYRSAEKIKGVA